MRVSASTTGGTGRGVVGSMGGQPPVGRRRTGALAAGLSAGLSVAAALAGCAGPAPAPAVVPAVVSDEAARTFTGEARAVTPGVLTAADVAAAHTAFGVELLHGVCAGDPGTNVLISPTSAALALGLLHPAAGGDTENALAAVLHLPDWSPDLVAATRELTTALDALRHEGDLDAEDAPDSLQVSNRVWTDTTTRPEQAYLDDVATAFDAGVRTLDFAGDPQGAMDAINDSVHQDTRGMIPRLFDEPLDPSTVAVVTNALHLKARWAEPFDPAVAGDFHADAGVRTADLMRGSGAARSVDGWTVVELPYRDGTLQAIAVLPPAGTDPCAVDAATLGGLATGEPERVDVVMPKLRLEQRHELLPHLEALGLPSAGDWSGLCTDCFVSDVVQKTVLEVDESGTEAAAATGGVMESSLVVEPPRVVTFDRPYLFVLTDTATRSPLFLTVVHDPTAS